MSQPERRRGDRRCNDPKSDPNLIHLTPNKLWLLFVLIWLTSVLASGGVGWYFAGRSARATTQALRQSSQSSEASLYNTTLNRCITGSKFRDTVIHNAILQKQGNPTVRIPVKGKPCADQVPNPETPVNPARQTAVG